MIEDGPCRAGQEKKIRDGSILKELDLLNDGITKLGTILEQLFSEIEPILNKDNACPKVEPKASAKCEEAPMEPMTQVSNKIRDISCRVKAISSNAEDVLSTIFIY